MNQNSLQIGELIADYRIDGVLGAGSFGVTYLAHDINLSRKVAIKEYMPVEYASRAGDGTVASRSEEASSTFAWGLERFSVEARTLAQFNHPNIVKVQRLIPHVNGTAYIVMELVEGTELEAVVLHKGTLSGDHFLSVFRQLLDGLEAVHHIGILHRDIKPSNIVMHGDTPVLIDFGAARDLAMQKKAGFSALVSDGYSPPEQYSSDFEQGQYTDIYALAATAYFMLAGIPPPHSGTRLLGDKMVPAETIGAGKAEPAILRGLDRGLSPRVEDRPQSVAQWREILGPLDRDQVAPAVDAEDSGSAEVPLLKRRAFLIGAGGLVVAAGAGAALFFGRDDGLNGSVRPLSPTWRKEYATLFNEPFAGLGVMASGVAIAAHRLGADGQYRMLALRVADDGRPSGEWVSDAAGSRAHAILPTADGGAYVGGEIVDTSVLVRLDRAWRPMWQKSFESGSITSLMMQPGGVIAGLEGPDSSGSAKLLYISDKGDLQNDLAVLDRSGDSVQRVIPLTGGGLAILGMRLEEKIVGGSKKATANLWLSKVGADGQELWRSSESGLGHANGWDVVEAGGRLYVTGRTSPDGNEKTNRLLLMCVDANGKKLWQRWDYQGLPASGRSLAVADADGDPTLYVAGWSADPHRTLLAQVASSGDLIWTFAEQAPAGSNRGAAALAIRKDGIAFMAGLSLDESQLKLSLTRFS